MFPGCWMVDVECFLCSLVVDRLDVSDIDSFEFKVRAMKVSMGIDPGLVPALSALKRKQKKPHHTTASPKVDPASAAPQLSKGKKWLFSIVAFVLVPLALLGFLELGLRIGGFGYPTAFFKRISKTNGDFLVENDK